MIDGADHEVNGTVISANDIVVRREPREGLVVAAQGSLSVALDVTITPDLAVEGVAREIVSGLQGLRRSLDLEVSDRIRLTWHTTDTDLAAALTSYEGLIGGEVLATQVERAQVPQKHVLSVNDRELSVAIARH